MRREQGGRALGDGAVSERGHGRPLLAMSDRLAEESRPRRERPSVDECSADGMAKPEVRSRNVIPARLKGSHSPIATVTVDNKTRQPRRATGLVIALLLLAACNPAAHDDTATIQGDIDRGTPLPAGTYTVGPLHDSPDTAITGAGDTATILRARDPGETILTLTGTHIAGGKTPEIQTGPTISGIGFEGHGGTGIRYSGLGYFALRDSSFSGFTVAVDQQGALQSEVHDVIFRDNVTGLRYAAVKIDYYGLLPPNRVLVSWSTFYGNTHRAIDYSGGQQLLVEDSEFGNNGTTGDPTSAAIWVQGAGDPIGPGLVMSGGWVENNHGYAAIDLSGPVRHSIRDTWLAYTDATYAIAQEGGSLVCDNVTMDQLHTVTAVLGGSC